jgi:protein involved in polysaccharide export with SLBB domain
MSLNGTVWVPIGPSPIVEGGVTGITANGQVTAIAVNPNNPNIIYIGTAWGGVWLTRDGGLTWTPLFDRAPSLGVGDPGALAIDPIDTNVLYVGTTSREGSEFSGEATQPPAGLFKSIDGGASWIRLGLGYPPGAPSNANIFFSQLITVVIVDPVNNQTVYLASNLGLFVSTDGGLNWTQGVAAAGDVRSLVLDTTSPAAARILYAGITGAGVVQSTNGGLNWHTVLTGATAVVATELNTAGIPGPPRSVGKFVVALAPPTSTPNPAGVQVLYATMEGRPVNRPPKPTDAPDPVGVFVSVDQGVTWTLQTPHNAGIPPGSGMPLTTQFGYSFHMAVDPASPGDGINDILYFGATPQARSTDSGQTFTPLTGLHSDTHAWAFAPQPGPFSVVYSGNDGGIFKGTGGTAFTSLNAGGMQTALVYNLDVKRDPTASVTLGALQDNGIVTNAPPAVFPTWTMGAGGDGFAVAHDGQNPTDVYGRSNSSILASATDGNSYTGITPLWSAAESTVYLAAVATDPNTAGVVYASSNQNLYQSTSGGPPWAKTAPIGGNANDVKIAPANSNNLAVAVGTRVLVSTNALGAFTLKDITRNLPGQFVSRLAFDPNDPATIYAVLAGFSGFPGGHVFRTTLAATAWTDISPPIDLPFNAIALDGSDIPTTLYAGTDFGVLRSVDGGGNWSVLDDIHFPGAPVFDLVFHNGELRAATFGRGVFSFVKPTGPSIAVGLEDDLAFGTVCAGSLRYLTIEISNVGAADLVVTSVQRLMGSSAFAVLPSPGTPLSLAPGENIEFTVAYSPSGAFDVATIRIITNDPNAPFVDLLVTGSLGTGTIATAIANSGRFGNVCLGSFADELLTINNSGTCPLSIFDIVGSPDFLAPSVLSYPLLVGPGDSIDVVIRFQPSAPDGSKVGSITVLSNDPAGPHAVSVSGVLAAPKANLIIADSGSFGDVCVGSFADEPLIVTNSGKCALSITGISSNSADFLAPEVLSYPITVGPGDALPVPIRFQPASFGAKAGTITVTSDDPASPISVEVSGDAPPGKLTVSGSTTFGGVNAGCCADRTLSICNTGDCALDVTSVHFRRRSRRWRLLNNPFPAKLRPGSCFPVVIQYRANEKCPRPCELVIESDDPVTPVKYVEVLAYTIWDNCCKEGCDDCRKADCDDCRKNCCDKHPRCHQGYPCCDDDDDRGDEDR